MNALLSRLQMMPQPARPGMMPAQPGGLPRPIAGPQLPVGQMPPGGMPPRPQLMNGLLPIMQPRLAQQPMPAQPTPGQMPAQQPLPNVQAPQNQNLGFALNALRTRLGM